MKILLISRLLTVYSLIAVVNTGFAFFPHSEKLSSWTSSITPVTLSNVSIQSCDTAYFKTDANCEAKIILNNAAFSSNLCQDSLMRWIVTIDIDDDGSLDWEISSFLPLNNDIINAQTGKLDLIRDDNGNGIPDVYVFPSGNGEEVTVSIPGFVSGIYPKLRVYWKVFDACQEVQRCEQIIILEDHKKPTPYCLSLSADYLLDPDGSGPLGPMIEFFAIEFNVGSFDNCTNQEDLLFTFDNMSPQIKDTVIDGRLINLNTPHYFNQNGAVYAYPSTKAEVLNKYNNGETQLWLPILKSSARVWTIKHFPLFSTKGDVDVQMSVWDKNYNTDYYWVKLSILYFPGCGGWSRIAGKILTQNEGIVENVLVRINRNSIEYPKSMLTVDGLFAFEEPISISASDKVMLTAEKDSDYSFGVSTLDLVQLSNHIKNIQPLTNPYQVIASDVNNDNHINDADIKELRKVLLGTKEKFGNRSWRFPVKNQFLNINNVFPYKDSISLLVVGDTNTLDFVAVKIGDINSSGSSGLKNDEPVNRTNESVYLKIKNKVNETTLSGNITVYEKEKTEELPCTITIYKTGMQVVAGTYSWYLPIYKADGKELVFGNVELMLNYCKPL